MPKPRAAKGIKADKDQPKKPPVDEYQLRRDLHNIIKSKEAEKHQQQAVTMTDQGKPSRPEDARVGGIEGGGTHSTLIVMNGKGEQLAEIKGPGTNHWAVGMKETANRINEMITRAKKEIGIPESQLLDCVGLYLSGCEENEGNQKLVETLKSEFPAASREYVVGSDTVGSLSTGTANGGVVLIAGTGSNALLENPDGKTYGCGGWGHMMGDEGSAYWMARRSCKYVFDDIDGLVPAPYPITYVWPAMKDYFKVADRNALLPHIYNNFEKSNIALFTKRLVVGCEKDDPLCKHIFGENGRFLAKHVNAVARKAHNDLKLSSGGLKVICVGSVWKSWDFLKNGFLQEIDECHVVDELSLMKLNVPSAVGACYRAADKIQCDTMQKHYGNNTNIFFHYQRDESKKGVDTSSALSPSCKARSAAAQFQDKPQ